jgi:hypothetical protein
VKRLLFAILGFLFLTEPAFASYGEVAYGYTVETANKRFILVIHWRAQDGTLVKMKGLEKYPANGLYRNDGSTEPLWTVDWSNWAFPLNDGRHAIRFGRGGASPHTGYANESFAFLCDGKVLKSYAVRDLIEFPTLLPHSVCPGFAAWGAASPSREIRFSLNGNQPIPMDVPAPDENAHSILINTLHGDRFVFDYTTGEIVSERRPVRWAFRTLLVFFLLFYAWRLRQRLAGARKPLTLRRLAGILAFGIGGMLGMALIGHLAHAWLVRVNVDYEHWPVSPFAEAVWRVVFYWPNHARFILFQVPFEERFPMPSGMEWSSGLLQTLGFWMLAFILPLLVHEVLVTTLSRTFRRGKI